MVRKLFKYEIIFYLRTLLPFELILIGIACLTRFVDFFANDSIVYSIVSRSSIFMFVIAMIVCFVMTFVTAITRYYKNLFTAEGYLSFTLPVTETQHIFVKLSTALLFTLITLLNAAVSICIATAGELFREIINAIGYLANLYFEYTGKDGVFYLIEGILAVIAMIACSYLMYYTCITIGQLAKKNRILAAFGIYFAYYIICQVLSTVFIVVVTFLPVDPILTYISEHVFETIHIVLCGSFVFNVIMAAVYFLVSRSIMHKKLNLE